MKKILFIAFVLLSTTLLNATDFPKDTLWTRLGNIPAEIDYLLFSRDETKVYACTTEGIAILDAKTGKDIEFVPNIDKAGSLKAESIDGSYYINRNMEKYDSKTREMIWKCPLRETKDFGIHASAVSENGLYIVITYYKQQNSTSQETTTADIYNTLTQEKVRSFNVVDAFTNLSISNDSKLLLYRSNRVENKKNYDVVYLLETETGKLLKQLYDRENGTTSGSGDPLAFNQISTKNNYAIAKWYDYVTVLDLKTLDSFVYTPSAGGVGSSYFAGITNDENFLFSGGVANKGAIELFDLKSKQIKYTLPRIDKNFAEAFATINNSNEILLIGQRSRFIAIDLKKYWTGVTSENQSETLFPNPTNGRLVLSNPQNHQINTITAYDILGRTYTLSANGNEVDVSVLADGRYFLKVGLADGSLLDFGFVKE